MGRSVIAARAAGCEKDYRLTENLAKTSLNTVEAIV
jgi:hypothetical protein